MASYLLTFSGDLQSGTEHFSHTLALDDTGLADVDAVADEAVAALNAMVGVSGFLALFPNTTSWKNVKAAEITNLGTGTLFAGVNRTVSHTGTGATATTHLPPQNAVAVSLVGGPRANGTPYRGRFYLPSPTMGANGISGGVLTANGQTTVANGVEALLDYLTDALDGRAPQVWSRKDALTSTVVSFRIGEAIDTVRSRRRDMPELYEIRTL